MQACKLCTYLPAGSALWSWARTCVMTVDENHSVQSTKHLPAALCVVGVWSLSRQVVAPCCALRVPTFSHSACYAVACCGLLCPTAVPG